MKLDSTTSQAAQVAAFTKAMQLRSAVSTVVQIVADGSSTVIGADYQDIDFGGATWLWTTTSGGCNWYTSYYVDTMPAGWNDFVSSAQSFSGCGYYWHYENDYENYYVSGAVRDCGWSCSYIGDAMNDRTSSETWNY